MWAVAAALHGLPEGHWRFGSGPKGGVNGAVKTRDFAVWDLQVSAKASEQRIVKILDELILLNTEELLSRAFQGERDVLLGGKLARQFVQLQQVLLLLLQLSELFQDLMTLNSQPSQLGVLMVSIDDGHTTPNLVELRGERLLLLGDDSQCCNRDVFPETSG